MSHPALPQPAESLPAKSLPRGQRLAEPDPAVALSLTGVIKQYPGVRALDGVDLSVAAGEVHAVLGENGAGKSTLVGVAAGSVPPDSGEIVLCGERFAALTPAQAREHGLALVYQTPSLAGSLTVSESMLLVVPEGKRPSRAQARQWTERLLSGLGLDIDANMRVSDLSAREAHLVEIAGAIASEPAVLVLDEPTEALGPDETQWLFHQIREVTDKRTAEMIKKDLKRAGIPYVDYYSAMADADGGLKGELSGDGVHPNDKGYEAMRPLVERGIAAALAGGAGSD